MPNREMSGNEAETVIAASVKVEGDFVSQGNVLIEGTVEGTLRTEKNLRVGERAVISADVFAASASVAGEINGNIETSERLELEPTARIHGDIRTKSLIVANGASIDGHISMAVPSDSAEAGHRSGSADRKGSKNGLKTRAEEAVMEPDAVMDKEEEKEGKVVNALFGR